MAEITGVVLSNSTDMSGSDVEVNAQDWHKMSLSQLWDQHAILTKRFLISQQLHKQSMTKGLGMGLEILNEIIQKKDAETEKSDLM